VVVEVARAMGAWRVNNALVNVSHGRPQGGEVPSLSVSFAAHERTENPARRHKGNGPLALDWLRSADTHRVPKWSKVVNGVLTNRKSSAVPCRSLLPYSQFDAVRAVLSQSSARA
jgi:hypothetical protein